MLWAWCGPRVARPPSACPLDPTDPTGAIAEFHELNVAGVWPSGVAVGGVPSPPPTPLPPGVAEPLSMPPPPPRAPSSPAPGPADLPLSRQMDRVSATSFKAAADAAADAAAAPEPEPEPARVPAPEERCAARWATTPADQTSSQRLRAWSARPSLTAWVASAPATRAHGSWRVGGWRQKRVSEVLFY